MSQVPKFKYEPEYDEDILDIWEEIDFPGGPIDASLFVEPGYDILTGQPKKLTDIQPSSSKEDIILTLTTTGQHQDQNNNRPASSQHHQRPPILSCTPHTNSYPLEPPCITGGEAADLTLLRQTSTIEELEMRKNNSVQRFITREGMDLYLKKETIERINFRQLQARKHKEKTVNLPDRYQARLRVQTDGKIIFHRYYKRGIKKSRNA